MALEFAREMREVGVAREEGGIACGIDARIQKILGVPELHFIDIGDGGIAESPSSLCFLAHFLPQFDRRKKDMI